MMKLPENAAEFEAIERRQLDKIESLRKTLANAQRDFERACNEYRDWKIECGEKGFR